jgi:hypothetical protein
VEGCIFTDISGNGFELGNVNMPDAQGSDITADNRIASNHFYNVGAEFRGGIPIVVGYAQRTRVEHNQIDHVPYAAISMGWGGWPDKIKKPGVTNFSKENIVAYNLIFDLMLVLADGGGIYTQGITGGNLAEGEKGHWQRDPRSVRLRSRYLHGQRLVQCHCVRQCDLPD